MSRSSGDYREIAQQQGNYVPGYRDDIAVLTAIGGKVVIVMMEDYKPAVEWRLPQGQRMSGSDEENVVRVLGNCIAYGNERLIADSICSVRPTKVYRARSLWCQDELPESIQGTAADALPPMHTARNYRGKNIHYFYAELECRPDQLVRGRRICGLLVDRPENLGGYLNDTDLGAVEELSGMIYCEESLDRVMQDLAERRIQDAEEERKFRQSKRERKKTRPR